MKKRNLWWAVCVLLFTGLSWGQPFPNDQQNHWAYQAVTELMQRAGISDDAIFEFRSRKDFTRMEFAIRVNAVMLKMEEQGLAISSDISEKVEKLSAEFQREFLLLQIQDAIEENRSLLEQLRTPRTGSGYELGIDFSLSAEKLDGRLPVSPGEQESFGEAPRHTKVMLAQQIRIKCLAKISPEIQAELVLRNFGYWGVGRYTSGSTDINFSSADPLKIDQAFIFWTRPRMRAELGRRKMCYGPWGLLVDRRLEPLNSMEIALGSRYQIRTLVASQFSGIDYLSTRFQMGGQKARIGATVFYTLFSRSEEEESGLVNEQGVGCDLEIVGSDWRMAVEYGLYNPARTKNILGGYVPGLIASVRLNYPRDFISELRVGYLAEAYLSKSIPLDIITLEYPLSEHHQFLPGTMGLHMAEEVKLTGRLSIRGALISLIKQNGTHYSNRLTGGLKWETEKMAIVLEDSYYQAKAFRYNQAGLMLKISF